MSIPKEPRQLMINLMYLVLTAMLAINVSSEILNAFKIINKSINRSIANIGEKNSGTLANFASALQDPKVIGDPAKKARIEAAMLRAKEVTEISKVMADKIAGYRNEIIKASGGFKPEIDAASGDSLLVAESNLDAATMVMIENKKRGVLMKDELSKFKDDLSKLAAPRDSSMDLFVKAMDSILPITFDYGTKSNTGTSEEWAFHNFHMVPTIGATTILDKFISDVKNSENIALDQIWAQAFGEKQKNPKIIQIMNQFALINAPENTYLLPGEKYKSKLMIGSYNTSNSQSVYIAVNGSPRPVVNGEATYETVADSKPGEHILNITGTIYDPNLKQQVAVTPIKASYFVGTAGATISLDKMNVFYIGVDNPITISASGVKMENLIINPSSNITYTRGAKPGEYFVRVTGPGGTKGTIALSGKRNDGLGVENFGTREYRIKKIPDPIIKYMKSQGPRLRVDLARVGLGPEAILENFDFDCKFDVIGYTLTVISKGEEQNYEIKGPFINSNPNAVKAMKALKAKDQLIFEEIRVMGCDKVLRKMPQLAFILVN